ncbi:unnamed protein product, partial [Polarella glacialis]
MSSAIISLTNFCDTGHPGSLFQVSVDYASGFTYVTTRHGSRQVASPFVYEGMRFTNRQKLMLRRLLYMFMYYVFYGQTFDDARVYTAFTRTPVRMRLPPFAVALDWFRAWATPLLLPGRNPAAVLGFTTRADDTVFVDAVFLSCPRHLWPPV